MNPYECAREEEVVRAVLSGAWPDRCDHELIAHSAHCEICAEVAAVAMVLHDDSEVARRDVHVPAAGQVWWRCAVRARLEAAQAATLPMTWLHGMTAAIAIGIMLAVAGMAWPSVASTVEWAKTVVIGLAQTGDVAGAVAGGLRQSLMLAIFAGACLLITPIAVYFALSDE